MNGPGMDARAASRVRLALLALVLLCAGLVVASLARRTERGEAEGAPFVDVLVAAEPGAVLALPPAAERRVPRVSPEPPTPVATPSSATVAGRVQLDGSAPARGIVYLEEARGNWRSVARIDAYGRFRVEGAPCAQPRVAFEADSPFERRVLLPDDLVLAPVSGLFEPLELVWSTRHVNVQVLSDPPSPAEVEIVGPGYRTRVSTDDGGKARLGLVGSGTFRFRASLCSGERGEADLELEGSDDLDTVVIPTGFAPAR